MTIYRNAFIYCILLLAPLHCFGTLFKLRMNGIYEVSGTRLLIDVHAGGVDRYPYIYPECSHEEAASIADEKLSEVITYYFHESSTNTRYTIIPIPSSNHWLYRTLQWEYDQFLYEYYQPSAMLDQAVDHFTPERIAATVPIDDEFMMLGAVKPDPKPAQKPEPKPDPHPKIPEGSGLNLLTKTHGSLLERLLWIHNHGDKINLQKLNQFLIRNNYGVYFEIEQNDMNTLTITITVSMHNHSLKITNRLQLVKQTGVYKTYDLTQIKVSDPKHGEFEINKK